tara:strand:- start:76 stop:750 length:675 start_codon:yes stop_codon:yes gene_type:complete
MKKASSFKMKGFTGFGNSPMKAKKSPGENLLKAVPNKEAYDKLSDENKKGFDKAAKKAGLPTKKSPAKQVSQKVTEGFSKNQHNYGKTTKVTTTMKNGSTSFVEKSNKTGRTISSGGGNTGVRKAGKTNFNPMKTMKPGVSGYEDFQKAIRNSPSKPSMPSKAKSKVARKATGKIAGKVAMKVGAKFLGPVGVAMTARDAYKSYKDIKGGMKVGKALKKNFLGL